VVTDLQKRAGGGEMASGDAGSMATQCADTLVTLGRSGGGAFRLADGQIALVDALGTQTGEMRAKVAEVLSWIPTQEAQRALLDAGLKDLKEGSTISPEEQKALLRAAAASARRFGDKADPAQVERLRMGFEAARTMGDFAKTPEARDLLAALSECYGSFNLGPQQSIKLILK
jgi:predicted transcriptional regulator